MKTITTFLFALIILINISCDNYLNKEKARKLLYKNYVTTFISGIENYNRVHGYLPENLNELKTFKEYKDDKFLKGKLFYKKEGFIDENKRIWHIILEVEKGILYVGNVKFKRMIIKNDVYLQKQFKKSKPVF